MAKGLNLLANGIETANPFMTYEGLFTYTLASIYGENGISPKINWSKPPVVGEPERRYLTVLTNAAGAVREGDIQKLEAFKAGFTAIKGTNADSGGPPCNPEILCLVMYLT